MFDQLTIGEKKSLDDFDASVASRTIGSPAKKVIKETVPFSNKTYDFSKINGELYWEERELEYVFEITADSPEQLEEKKRNFSGWIMNVMEEEIYDPFDPGFHFIGTYEDMSYEDDEGMEKTTATVVFKAYPFRVGNNDTATNFFINIGTSKSNVSVNNLSSHSVFANVNVPCKTEIEIGGKRYLFNEAGDYKAVFSLAPGENAIAIDVTMCSPCYGLVEDEYHTHKITELYDQILARNFEIYENVTVDRDTGTKIIYGKNITDDIIAIASNEGTSAMAEALIYKYMIDASGTICRPSMNILGGLYSYTMTIGEAEGLDTLDTVGISYRCEVF